MKRFWLFLCLLGMFARLLLATPGDHHTSAQKMTVASFNNLFRTLDLNAATQKSYSITKSEYAQLLDAWNRLADSDRMALQSGSTGWTDFAAMLLFDLYLGTSWKDHVLKADRYGATGISITVSRYKRILVLKKARKTLVDLLQEGPPLVVDGRLALSDRIKSEAEKRSGDKALQRLNQWERLINRKQSAPDRDKMKAVAAFFEKYIQQTPDRDEAKGYDYWQSPIETLVRGKGDCDDFAVAHYVSLRLLGIPAERLRIGLVTHPVRGGHGVVFSMRKMIPIPG
ncbi:MAG: transglutaminase-like cysteine peptidase [candidate division KSB1 bacterium]|nr:transglutaminase-like cysteine peptidase [candidate division KSB1 bacterium]